MNGPVMRDAPELIRFLAGDGERVDLGGGALVLRRAAPEAPAAPATPAAPEAHVALEVPVAPAAPDAPPTTGHLLDRHVLAFSEHAWREGRTAVPALPPGTVLLTNSAAVADELPVPADAVVFVADAHGVTLRGDASPKPVESPDETVVRSGARHVRVVVDGRAAGLDAAVWSDAFRAVLRLHEWTFLTVRALAPHLDSRASFLVTVLGGVDDRGVPRPFTGLFTGFTKSLALEYPDTPVVATLHDASTPLPVVERSARELGAAHLLPVVVHHGERRLTPRATVEPAVGGAPPLSERSLVVAAGGGRGIGAALLSALARRHRPRLVLLGSTDLDEHRDETAADRAAFIRARTRGPDRVTVAEANRAFDRVEQARALRATLAGMEEQCGPGRVVYLRCDLRSPDAVQATLDRVVAEQGPIDLLLNIAGTNRASAVATKSREDFLAVRDLKLTTYLNLKTALRGRTPRRWINFGSFVGFTGQVGETDYASANDFLFTAAMAAGPGESTTGWTLWRDTGLGAGPVMRAFLAKSGQYSAMSTEEGVAHFTAELADPRQDVATVFYGEKEREAIAAAVPELAAFQSPGAGAPPRRRLPFLDAITRDGDELTAVRAFDLDRDGYLKMHRVHGYPTLPGTFVPELAAEAAVALVPDRVPVVFEDLRLESFLRLYRADRPEVKRIRARLVSSDEVESVVHVRVLGDVVSPNGTTLAADRLHFSVTVRLRDAPTPPPRWQHWSDDGARPLADPYHVPGSAVLLTDVFKSTADTRLHPLGRRARADLDAGEVRRWFPDLLVPVVLIDGLIRVAVLDRLDDRWTPVAIPRSVRRIDLYGTHTDASLATSGAPVELYVTPVDIDLEASRPDNRALAVAANGDVLLQVQDIVGAVVGYVDQSTGDFLDRATFDSQFPGRTP